MTEVIFAAPGTCHMSVIFLLLSVSTMVAGVFLAGFIWAVRKGQYDDNRSPAVRMLMDDAPASKSGNMDRGPWEGPQQEPGENAQAHITVP